MNPAQVSIGPGLAVTVPKLVIIAVTKSTSRSSSSGRAMTVIM